MSHSDMQKILDHLNETSQAGFEKMKAELHTKMGQAVDVAYTIGNESQKIQREVQAAVEPIIAKIKEEVQIVVDAAPEAIQDVKEAVVDATEVVQEVVSDTVDNIAEIVKNAKAEDAVAAATKK